MANNTKEAKKIPSDRTNPDYLSAIGVNPIFNDFIINMTEVNREMDLLDKSKLDFSQFETFGHLHHCANNIVTSIICHAQIGDSFDLQEAAAVNEALRSMTELGKLPLFEYLTKLGFPISREEVDNYGFAQFKRNIISACAESQKLGTTDLLLLNNEIDKYARSLEESTGRKPRWYECCPDVFQAAEWLLSRFGFEMPIIKKWYDQQQRRLQNHRI